MNILKSTIRFGVLATTVYLCSACDALDLSPIDYYGSSNYWTKPEHIIGYMDGLHKNLRDKTYQHQCIRPRTETTETFSRYFRRKQMGRIIWSHS